MIPNLITAISSEDVAAVRKMLDENANLAKATFSQRNNASNEIDEMPLLALTYSSDSEKMEAIRQKFLEKGAEINYRFHDGGTLGHSFASIAATSGHPKAYGCLITWIQDGGDVSLKDREGHNPVQLITKLAFESTRLPHAQTPPGFSCASAILLGLDKRNPFPARLIENGACDNIDELEELTSPHPKLIKKLQKKDLTLKEAYAHDTVAYRACRDLLLKHGADVNVEIQGQGGGNLGHLFAMEAANRNSQRHYLRLISWIRDGGNLQFKDKIGCTPIQRLFGYAFFSQNTIPFPGLEATLSILQKVNADKANDPAAKTDSRQYKYNPYPSKFYGACKADKVQILDTKEGLELILRESFQTKILALLGEGGIKVEDIARTKPLSVKMKLYEGRNANPLPEQAVKYGQALLQQSELPKDTSTPSTTISSQTTVRRQSVVTMELVNQEKVRLVEEVASLKSTVAKLSNEKHENERLQQELGKVQETIRSKEKQLHEVDGTLRHLLKELEELEEGLICPISHEPMVDPVISTISGQTYEKERITEWLRKNNFCPLTRLPMTVADLKPNFALRKLIELYQEKLARIKLALARVG